MTAQSKRVALCGLLLALMLVLGYVESLLPAVSGVPGIKLGLSNGVLIFAVYMLNVPTAFVLMGLKVALSGMLFGGVSAMIYAAAGGVLSLTVMCLLSRVRGLHPVDPLIGIPAGAGQGAKPVSARTCGSPWWGPRPSPRRAGRRRRWPRDGRGRR